MEVWVHAFLILALVGSEWLAYTPAALALGKVRRSTHWIGHSVGSRLSLDAVEERETS
jgi:hypothetical protein